MAALGIFFASRLKRIESFSILSQIIIVPMAFLSGAFFPLKNVPSWMITISHYNPLAYSVDALRWVVLSRSLDYEKNLTYDHTFFTSMPCFSFYF